MNSSYRLDDQIQDSDQFTNFKRLEHIKFDIDLLKKAAHKVLKESPLDSITSQLCFTHTPMQTTKDLKYEGVGSLTTQWSKNPYGPDGELKKREFPLVDKDFTVFNDHFKNTYFFEIYNEIQKSYTVGRFRLISLTPKKCMSWHQDPEERIHFAIHTDTSCRMVIENESIHISEDGVPIWCDTKLHHTAFNGSHKLHRLHLVIGIHTKKP